MFNWIKSFFIKTKPLTESQVQTYRSEAPLSLTHDNEYYTFVEYAFGSEQVIRVKKSEWDKNGPDSEPAPVGPVRGYQ